MKSNIIYFFIITLLLSCSSPPPKVITLPDEVTKSIKDLVAMGDIEFNSSLNRVYVSPTMWNSIDFKTKEVLTGSFAVYIVNQKGGGRYWIDIYDKMTGKKIAGYNHGHGLEVY